MNTLSSTLSRKSRTPLLKSIIPQPQVDAKVFWSRLVLIFIVLEAVILIFGEATLMYKERHILNLVKQYCNTASSCSGGFESFVAFFTYRGAFIFSCVFGVYVGWDAILHQNIIQIIGLVGFYLAEAVFCAIQYKQTTNIYNNLTAKCNGLPKSDPATAYCDGYKDPEAKGFNFILLALVPFTFVWFIVFAGLAFLLFREFGWRIYRKTGGNKFFEIAFTNYHVVVLLFKFAAFFVTEFTVLVLVLSSENVNSFSYIAIPVIGFPFLLGTYIIGYFGVRYENIVLTYIYYGMSTAVVGYIIWRIDRIYDPITSLNYNSTQLPLMFYGIVGMLLVIVGIIFTVICMRSYGKGLKDILDQDVAPPSAGPESDKSLGRSPYVTLPHAIDLDA